MHSIEYILERRLNRAYRELVPLRSEVRFLWRSVSVLWVNLCSESWSYKELHCILWIWNMAIIEYLLCTSCVWCVQTLLIGRCCSLEFSARAWVEMHLSLLSVMTAVRCQAKLLTISYFYFCNWTVVFKLLRLKFPFYVIRGLIIYQHVYDIIL